ncbi:DUF1315 family protein [Alginatibacterium sediminis]|uniref:DUF1315 family protein n=1 Tax=Alginatibacterium sediminis TaxID=2164068 RepID=A0A420EI86_9ALTE|nr:DUF1315 family protein [Alginatibacterium sediminis]RKF20432.1 DUF1315 family protein [Alginatibacterium sediminis]
MDVEKLLAAMTPEIYHNICQAVETGRWPDGRVVSDKQREDSLQLMMLYQSKHNVDAQHMSVGTDGEIVMKSKQALKQQFKDDHIDIQMKH